MAGGVGVAHLDGCRHRLDRVFHALVEAGQVAAALFLQAFAFADILDGTVPGQSGLVARRRLGVEEQVAFRLVRAAPVQGHVQALAAGGRGEQGIFQRLALLVREAGEQHVGIFEQGFG